MISVTTTSGGLAYAPPFVGPVNHTLQIKLDVSAMTTDEIDSDGYLKPGVPLRSNGTLIGSTQFVFGVTVEAQKVREGNANLGSDTSDPLVTVGVIGAVNRDIIEDNLGRVLTAAEIAGFDLAGCKIVLSTT